MNRYERKADRIIKKLVSEGRQDFIIFPFGLRGMEVKRLLNERYGIMEKYIVDNGLAGISKIPNLLSIRDIKGKSIKGYSILFSSDQGKLYNELRSQVSEIADGNEIIDLFSPSEFVEASEYGEDSHFTYVRAASLEAASKEIYRNHVEGELAELGVYRGDFARYIAQLIPNRTLYLFDTFEGFDERDNRGNDDVEIFSDPYGEWNFRGTSVKTALGNIGSHVNTVVRKGYFPETAGGLEDKRFAFVSIDTDLYEPTRAGLDFFWSKMSPGGYIFVHDFAVLQGVRKAVIEFCCHVGTGYTRLPDDCASAVIMKPLAEELEEF